MKEIELKSWTDGTMYQNTVWDDDKKEKRPLTDFEDKIVKWCFSNSHSHISEACAELGYNRFEMEMFKSSDLLQAGQDICEYYRENKGYISKIVKEILKSMPDYISIHKKGA